MVEISYGEHYELAELAGKSVVEVRELYKTEFEIPDRAQAVLNDKPLKKKMEDKIRLEDADELSFEEKERSRKPLFITAILLALAISGGLFAYTWTTATATLTGVADATGDFASVTANTTGISSIIWQPFGRYRGTIPEGILFNVTPTTGYDGDLEVTVYLANPDQLSQNYRFWMLRLRLLDGTTPVDAQEDTQVLTLNNGQASFYWYADNYTAGNTYDVKCMGGSYIGLPWVAPGWADTHDPILFCEVTQAGLKGTP